MSEIPQTKYTVTVTIHGNTHDEIVNELLSLTRGGYLLATDYYKRDECHSIGGRRELRLEHTNPDQTPEGYSRDLHEWFEQRKAARREGKR